MDILHTLDSREGWTAFLEYKVSHGHLSKKDEASLTAFIAAEDYLPFWSRFAGEKALHRRENLSSAKKLRQKAHCIRPCMDSTT